MCKCFTYTSDNPQGDSNKKDIINFKIDKVIKELNDSLNCDNLKNQAIKVILLLVLMKTRVTAPVIPTLYMTMTLLRIQLI